MIGYHEAVAMVRERARPLPAEDVSFESAHGRIAARGLESPGALPPFGNSAMDGFALHTGGREVPAGRSFPVAGRVAAGDAPGATDTEDAAWEIMTGAPVPDGLDAVIPVEKVEVIEQREGDVGRIRLTADVAPGDNVRPAGADFAPGDPVLERGRRVGPAELMALAALGIGRVQVFRRPRAAVLATGAELVDDPTEPLTPGRIRNSNGPYRERALRETGVDVLRRRTLGDDVEPFVREVKAALEQGADLVVSSGAVSMGRHDFVPRALQTLGGRVLFHRAAIRPGKPVLVAELPGGALHFGLPGNPISAAVGLRFFVEPFLRELTGRGTERPWRLPLARPVSKRPELRYFTRGALAGPVDGTPEVAVLPGQQSFRIAPLLDAQVWVVLPEGVDEVEAGALVEVYGLHGPPVPEPRRGLR